MSCPNSSKTPEKLQVLQDENFPWREKKRRACRLARLYDLAGYPDYGDRAASCAAFLQYLSGRDEAGTPVRRLFGAAFCQLRLCPMCNARRARRAAVLLSKVMDEAQRRERGVQYIFLTLTVRNVAGPNLGDAISGLCKAWYYLVHQRKVERLPGWFRAIEITRNPGDGTYHPHIHAILAVDGSYFDRGRADYIGHDEWVERWQKALRADYAPSVRIQSTRGRGRKSSGLASAQEAAKYATKDEEYVGQRIPEAVAVEVVRTYTEALYRKRLTAFGGLLKTVARDLKAGDLEQGDLVHVDDEAVREDLMTMIETYRWMFGVGDYVLERVEDWKDEV